MLKVSKLCSGYGKSQVLNGLDFEVRAGEIVTLIGANGAGKTTTLKTLCGVVAATGGKVEFEGRDLTNRPPYDIVDAGITMIPEGRQLFPHFTVKDNLLMGSYKRAARPIVQRKLEEVLQIFPRVRERLAQYAGSLSGGEQQMVAIARGMMADPKLLVFDEPSLGLSPLLVQQMFDIIRDVTAHGVTVLLVEQNVFRTLRLADRGYVLENGAIVRAGTGAELLGDPMSRRPIWATEYHAKGNTRHVIALRLHRPRQGRPARHLAPGRKNGSRRAAGADRSGLCRRQPSGCAAAVRLLSAAARRVPSPGTGSVRHGHRHRPAGQPLAGRRPGLRVDARRRLRAILPGRRTPLPAGATRHGPADRRRHSRELLHGLDQCVRARAAGGGRALPGARRLQRHRPDRHPAGARFGAEVWTTVGSAEKAAACIEAGARHALIYRDTDYEDAIRQPPAARAWM